MVSMFIIKAVDVNMEQAQKVAEILFPDCENVIVTSIENDENTLTHDDYETLRNIVNDKLVESIKSNRVPYDEISHPIDLKYKKLLEKMNKRVIQFPPSFV